MTSGAASRSAKAIVSRPPARGRSSSNSFTTGASGYDYFYVNSATSSIELGPLGETEGDGPAAGSFTLDAGETLTDGGYISAPDVVIDGALAVGAGESKSITGSDNIDVNGSLTVGAGASLLMTGGTGSYVYNSTLGEYVYVYTGGLTGAGAVQIGANAAVTLSGAVDPTSQNTIDFAGAGAVLSIAPSTFSATGQFLPTIYGFSAPTSQVAGDTIDYQGSITTASFSPNYTGDTPTGGVLTLLDGSAVVGTLDFVGDYVGSTFYVANDEITVYPGGDVAPTIAAPAQIGSGENIPAPVAGVAVYDSTVIPLMTVTLTATNGILLAQGGGTITGSGSNSLAISGSVGEVNADLTTLQYEATSATNDTIAISASNGLGVIANQTIAVVFDANYPTAPTLTDASVVDGYVSGANDTTAQAITGETGPGDTVRLYLDGSTSPAFTTTADGSGNWSWTIGALANGTYSYVATAEDAAGNVSAPSARLNFTVDVTPPAAPTLSDASIVNGTVNAPNDTPAQVLTGMAAPSDTVKVYLNGSTAPAFTTTADPVTGDWSVTLGALANGSYSYAATATDAAGNVSPHSSSLSFTVDTVTPTVLIGTSGEITNHAAQTIAGTVTTTEAAAGSTVTLYDNGGEIATTTLSGTDWSTSITLSEGSNRIVAEDTDAVGNTGTSSPVVFTLDTQPPTVSITTSGETTSDASQTISGTVTTTEAAAGSTVTLYDNGTQVGTATLSDGSWSTSITLNEGSNSIVAEDTDAVGNTGTSLPVAFTLEASLSSPPTLTVTSEGGVVIQAQQTVSGMIDAADALATVTLFDGSTEIGTAQPDSTTGAWSTTVDLANPGDNVITAEASNSAGTGTSPSVDLILEAVTGSTITLTQSLPSVDLATVANQGYTLDVEDAVDNSSSTLSVGPGGEFAAVALESGSTIVGGTIDDPSSQVTFAGGVLDGVTYEGTLDLTQPSSSVIVENGLTATGADGTGPGTIDVGDPSTLTFDDTQTIDDATINLAGDGATIVQNTTAAAYTASGAQTLTFGANLTIDATGSNASIVSAGSPGGTIVNGGTIDVESGSLTIDPANFINDGAISVTGGALTLNGNWTNTAGSINVSSGGTVNLQGDVPAAALGSIANTGGTVALEGTVDGGTVDGGAFDLTFSGATLQNVTYEGTLDLTPSSSSLTIVGGLTATGSNGTGSGEADLGPGSALTFDDTQTFDNATIKLEGVGSSLVQVTTALAYVSSGAQTLTFGPNVTVDSTSGNASILSSGGYGGTVVSEGTIDVKSGTLTIDPASFANDGTIDVTGGAALYLQGVWTNAGGKIAASGGGAVFLEGAFQVSALGDIVNAGGSVTLQGTIDGGTLVGAAFDMNFFDATLQGVTYLGALDLTPAYSSLTVQDGLTAKDASGTGPGTVNLGDHSAITFDDTQTFDNATINLDGLAAEVALLTTPGAYAASGAQTLTFGPNLTIDANGANDSIGTSGGLGGAILNDGTINVASGSSLTVDPAGGISGTGTLSIGAGATLEIGSALAGNTVQFLSNSGVAQLDDLASVSGGVQQQNFNGQIEGIGFGDVLRVEGFGKFAGIDTAIAETYNSTQNTTTLSLSDGGASVATLTSTGRLPRRRLLGYRRPDSRRGC